MGIFRHMTTGLIPAMEIDNIHDITVIIDSITAARKILESKVDRPSSEYVHPLSICSQNLPQ